MDDVVREALRRNDRYVLEVVESFNLCPFARGARTSGRSVREVFLDESLDLDRLRAVVSRYEREAPEAEVLQWIFPRAGESPEALDAVVVALRPCTEVFAFAAFHPGFRCDPSTPDALVPFFRKTPDPTVQAVRRSVLDGLAREGSPYAASPEEIDLFLRGKGPPPKTLGARIARDNHARYHREGAAVFEALYASLAADTLRADDAGRDRPSARRR